VLGVLPSKLGFNHVTTALRVSCPGAVGRKRAFSSHSAWSAIDDAYPSTQRVQWLLNG
jgi:hypothetical protein